ncbi:outer membrane protein [Mucilaginibacter yixingensis]|uniref:Outer membrane protein n=1 Tax=Mucilaginibacter yixingensis TaxID=1295612 RepID=A0A2T5JGF5_9SPHI|nr:TolC family protein [Mucilaginibacter yixingensis]PTR01520.1 outer membrane protein [Mucilaginibacter yixingensis]
MMPFKKHLLTLFLLTCSVLAHAQQNNVITLQQCIDIAVKNNLEVKQTNNTMLVDSINYKQSKENLLPSLTGNASRSLNQGRGVNSITNTYINQSFTNDSYGLNTGVTLFNGLALQNNIKQALLAYKAGKMDLQAAKDQVTINVITNYMAVLNAEETLLQTQSNLAVSKEVLERLEIQEQQGNNKAASDIYDQRGIYATNKVNVVNAKNALNAAKLSLFQLMNIAYQPDAELQALNPAEPAARYSLNPQQIYEIALQQLPQIKAAILKRESAEKSLQMQKSRLFPTLTLGGSINTNYSSASQNTSYFDQFKNNYATNIGLNLSIPLFTGHTQKNNIAIAKISLNSYKDLQENTRTVLLQNVEQTYYNMTAAQNRYLALQDAVKAYTESFRISKIRFEAGVLTSVDFIISKNNVDAANLNLITARYDYLIYSRMLDYYQGKL